MFTEETCSFISRELFLQSASRSPLARVFPNEFHFRRGKLRVYQLRPSSRDTPCLSLVFAFRSTCSAARSASEPLATAEKLSVSQETSIGPFHRPNDGGP